MHTSKWFTTSLAAVPVAMAAVASARDHALVKDKVAASRILLAKTAGPIARHAAAELARYLEKVSGASVEIQTAPARGLYSIFMGTADSRDIPLSDAMKAGVSRIASQGFMLAADDQGLRIIGRQPIGFSTAPMTS